MRSVFKLLGLLIALLAALTVITVVLFSIFLLALGFVFGGADAQPDSFSHEIDYTAEIHTNGTLNNTEILLPYPDDQLFVRAVNGNVSNATVRNELNATLSAVNTSRGVMLKAEIDSFTPETHKQSIERINDSELPDDVELGQVNRTGIDRYRRHNIAVNIDYNRTINTSNGLKVEPHLRSERYPAARCDQAGDPECFESSTKAFLSYDTGNDTYMDLEVRLEGRNSWFTMGWSSNSYSQRFYTGFYEDLYFTGSQNKWVELTGRETQGEGTYRD